MTSGAEWIIILLVIIAVFGASWLPKAARNLGRAKVELDKTKKQIDETTKQVAEASGLNQVNKGLQQAKRLSNKTPQQLIKGAALSSAAGAVKPSTDEPASHPAPTAEAAAATHIDPVTEIGDNAATINLDFSD